jgi:hypothetical protein
MGGGSASARFKGTLPIWTGPHKFNVLLAVAQRVLGLRPLTVAERRNAQLPPRPAIPPSHVNVSLAVALRGSTLISFDATGR